MNTLKFNDENLIDQLPFLCVLKDRYSNYVSANRSVLDTFKFKNADECIGKSDFELPCRDYADVFLEQDKLSLKGNTQFYVNTSVRTDGKKIIIMHKKSPFIKEGAIQGVICAGIELTRENYKNLMFYLGAANLNFSDFVSPMVSVRPTPPSEMFFNMK